MTKLTGEQIAAEKLDGWAYLVDALHTRIATPDFATGLGLVDAIGAAAEEMNHHPDVDLRYSSVNIRLTSHDTGAVTARDIRLARRIDELATEVGLTTDRAPVSRLDIGLDTPDARGVADFWAAVLRTERRDPGGDPSNPGSDPEIVDPAAQLPTVWFQRSGSEEPRQHWHFDLWLDPSQVQPTIDAALAAGGTLVSDAYAPRFWVLADAEGNKVCLCAWTDRG